MQTSEATSELFAALAVAQMELKNPEKTREATVKGKTQDGRAYEYSYKYADIADVLASARPILGKHGIAVMQPTVFLENGDMAIETILAHSSGQWIKSIYPVCRPSGKHQDMGAALTYARRYALCPMIGVAADDDVDAENAAPAGNGVPMSPHQARQELNWDQIIGTIREAATERKLDNIAARVEARRGHWPNNFLANAFDEIRQRREELAAADAGTEVSPDARRFGDAIRAAENGQHLEKAWQEAEQAHEAGRIPPADWVELEQVYEERAGMMVS